MMKTPFQNAHELRHLLQEHWSWPAIEEIMRLTRKEIESDYAYARKIAPAIHQPLERLQIKAAQSYVKQCRYWIRERRKGTPWHALASEAQIGETELLLRLSETAERLPKAGLRKPAPEECRRQRRRPKPEPKPRHLGAGKTPATNWTGEDAVAMQRAQLNGASWKQVAARWKHTGIRNGSHAANVVRAWKIRQPELFASLPEKRPPKRKPQKPFGPHTAEDAVKMWKEFLQGRQWKAIAAAWDITGSFPGTRACNLVHAWKAKAPGLFAGLPDKRPRKYPNRHPKEIR